MALQINLETEQGFTSSTAYVVIERIMYDKVHGRTDVQANIYKDKASRDAGSKSIKQVRTQLDYDIAGSDIIAQGYDKLKTEESMAGSTDV